MSGTADRRIRCDDKNRSGCPRNNDRELGRPPGRPDFELADAQMDLQSLNVLDNVRAIGEGVDADVPVDAQNAPTSDLENCRQFSTAPTPITVFLEEERRTKNERQKQRNPTVHQIGSGPNSLSKSQSQYKRNRNEQRETA